MKRWLMGAFLALWVFYLGLWADILLETESLEWLWSLLGRGAEEMALAGMAVHFASLLFVRWGVFPWSAEKGAAARWAARIVLPLLLAMVMVGSSPSMLVGLVAVFLGGFTLVDSLTLLLDRLPEQAAGQRAVGANGERGSGNG